MRLVLPIYVDERYVSSFEKEFAARLGVSRAIVAPYARTSLYHTLKAMDLPPGSELITTPITIHDIVNVIHLAGCRPVFIDIDPQTCQMDPKQLREAITEQS